MIKLSDRLLAIAKMVTSGKKVADIGTDHAYVPIYLAENNISSYIIAADINIGPLKTAEDHIDKCKQAHIIKCRVSDGLLAFSREEIDSFIITGMGGELIISILQNGIDRVAEGNEFIISPHTHISDVRKYLRTNGFKIIAENMVIDEGKYYSIIKCKYSEGYRDYTYEDYDDLFGKLLLNDKNEVLFSFLNKELDKYSRILTGLTDNERIKEINNYISSINKAKELYN